VRRWLLVLVLASATALSVAHTMARGRRAQRDWGATVPVVVVSTPVDAGQTLAAATRVRSWPVALAPAAALTQLPRGARARVALPTGTPLSPSLLLGAAEADLSDRVVVAVPHRPEMPAVAVNDRVDLWDASTPRPRVVGADAVVTAVRGEAVEVAVSGDDLRGVVGAVALGSVVLVVVSPAA
jgi:hypothetical protein